MSKKIGVLLMTMMLVVSTLFSVGCSSQSNNNNNKNSTQTKNTKMKIAALKGPTGMGMVKLMDENKNDYNISLYDSPDQIVSKVVNGEVDVAAVSSNLAPILYNKTKGKVQLLQVNTLGVLYVVENGNTIKDIQDLKGKTVYSSGKGGTPEYVFNYILKKNGLEPGKDVRIEYKMQHSDLAAAVASKKIQIAVLPEPFVSTTQMKDKDMKVQIDLNKEWEKVSGGSKLVMGTLVVRKDFAEKNPKVLDEFLNRYKSSVNFVNKDKKQAAGLIQKYGIVPNAKVAEMAIPKCNIVFFSAQDAKKSLNQFYEVLKENDPKSIGGKMPDDNFYYKSN